MDWFRELQQKVEEKNFKMAVIGLGYVGLPLAVAFARQGIEIFGVDISKEKVSSLLAGKSYVQDVSNELLEEVLRARKFFPTTDFRNVEEADLVSICVPTPLRKTGDPDISYIVAARDSILPYLREGQVIVLESTTYPGTTTEIFLPYLEKKGLRVGKNFFLAFSPERVD